MATSHFQKQGKFHAYSLFNEKENGTMIRRLREKGKLSNQKVMDLYQLKSNKYGMNYSTQKKYSLGRVKSLKPKRNDSQGIGKNDKFSNGGNFGKKL